MGKFPNDAKQCAYSLYFHELQPNRASLFFVGLRTPFKVHTTRIHMYVCVTVLSLRQAATDAYM